MAYIPDGLVLRRRRENVPQTAREIFEFYCELADSEFGICFPSLNWVAAQFGMRTDNLKKYDRLLHERGWICIHKLASGREVRQVFAGWEPLALRGKKYSSAEEAAAVYEQFIFSDMNSLKFRKLEQKLGFSAPEFLKFREILLNFRVGFLNFRDDFLKFRNAYKEYNHSSEPDSSTSLFNQEEEGNLPPPPPEINFLENPDDQKFAERENFDDEPKCAEEARGAESAKGNVEEGTDHEINPGVRPDIESDEEFLNYLKTLAKYKNLAVVVTYAKMLDWCARKKKPPNRFRLLNWLERDLADVPMIYQLPADATDISPPPAPPIDCPRCYGSGIEAFYDIEGNPLGSRPGCRHEPLIEGEWLWKKRFGERGFAGGGSEEFYEEKTG